MGVYERQHLEVVLDESRATQEFSTLQLNSKNTGSIKENYFYCNVGVILQ